MSAALGSSTPPLRRIVAAEAALSRSQVTRAGPAPPGQHLEVRIPRLGALPVQQEGEVVVGELLVRLLRDDLVVRSERTQPELVGAGTDPEASLAAAGIGEGGVLDTAAAHDHGRR